MVRLPELEIGVFGLLGTGVVLLNLVNGAIQKTFTQILSYAYSGAEDVGPLLENEIRTIKKEPNLALFRRSFRAMFRMQIFIGLPLLFIGAASVAYGIGKLVDWGEDVSHLWIAFSLFVINQVLLLFTTRYQSALRAARFVSDINRFTAFFNTLSILVGAIALLWTKSLVFLVLAQLVVATIQRAALTRYSTRKIPSIKGEVWTIREKDVEIEKASRGTIFKNALAEASGRGFRAFLTIYITSFTALWGVTKVVSFNFSVSLLISLVSLSLVPMSNKIPGLTKNYLSGDRGLLRKKLSRSIALSLLLFSFGAGVIGLLGPWALSSIDANVSLVNRNVWFLGAACYCVSMLFSNLELFCNIDNQVQFLWYNISSALLISAILIFFGSKLQPTHVILLMTLPFLLIKGQLVARVFWRRVCV